MVSNLKCFRLLQPKQCRECGLFHNTDSVFADNGWLLFLHLRILYPDEKYTTRRNNMNSIANNACSIHQNHLDWTPIK